MKMDVLLGLQWGDEGKGKIVDFLAPKYNVVARFQGGPNAGHTLEFDGIKHVLHQIPSGIFRKDIVNIIGNGVVLDPVIFRKEVAALDKYNLNVVENLFISKKTQLILPTHRLLDAAYEEAKGKKKIGSTLKGIGPAYQDKVSRQGLRVGDILSPDFRRKYSNLVDKHLEILSHYNTSYNMDELEKEFFDAIDYLKTFALIEGEYKINSELNSGAKVLAEGAQGSLLDIDFGSYPYVTSSNTTTSGACSGLGVAPNKIGEVYGIFKAYCTRVGGGPFPTELFDDDGKEMQRVGNEFGATTGRPRRCGWLDLPALKYAIMINGVTQLFMMKADVLNIFERIKVCTHYKLPNGEVSDVFPYEIVDQAIEPVYKELPGWHTSLEKVEEFESLPRELKNYVSYLEAELNVPISIISIGPDRTQTILRNGVLA
ncbi:Adenylosuccinate synthetase [Fulvivirga imtechensis AK7]|uniref:Adenylosuccinate synthetase n=1 Tax=Fulvivirga imtechensis AK7 TaxID=1237149 RepID=L8JMJ3_9BACT|nr:adenylosuccinate synthase [Fulvivirga imtechensis]ELR68612.1 Adenylosuccinate synthetase [Fulvivirga imtechensis AK7]